MKQGHIIHTTTVRDHFETPEMRGVGTVRAPKGKFLILVFVGVCDRKDPPPPKEGAMVLERILTTGDGVKRRKR